MYYLLFKSNCSRDTYPRLQEKARVNYALQTDSFITMCPHSLFQRKLLLMQKIYDWMIRRASHPSAVWLLGALSFIESSFSPIPPDPLLIPMIIAKPHRAWFLALVCTGTSVVGGLLGYAIGYYFFTSFGLQILEFYGLVDAFHKLQDWFNEWGFWIIVVKGLTPIPYKVVTITCGAIKFDLGTFVLASVISRGTRFFIEAALFWKYGARMDKWLRKYATLLTVGLVLVLAAGFVVIKYLV